MDVADPERGGGDSVFKFQDSEADLEDAFEKNIPFALDVAMSAKDPANPVSHLGNEAADFEVSTFDTSYGTPQDVQADVKRELGPVTMRYTINGGTERTSSTKEWDGGEVYGADSDIYYHRVRGTVKDAKPGQEVRVWFTAGGERSQAFTYTVASDSGAPVLVMAAEDYSGAHQRARVRGRHEAELPEVLHRRPEGQRRRVRRLGRRRPRPHGAGSARRPQPLQGGDLVHGQRLPRP